MNNEDEEPKTGDKITIGDEVALVLSRAGNQWFVLRDNGEVRHCVTDSDGIIKTSANVYSRN
jgi:hypothetical protein